MSKKILISQDLLWKGIIEELFFDFLEYFYGDWAKQNVDFNVEPVFLNDVLEKIYEKTKEGSRNADKLVKVFLKDGTETFFFLHVEIQGYEDPMFAYRMFVSFYRILDNATQNDAKKYFTEDKLPKIAALAIYTDEVETFRPNEFQYSPIPETYINYGFKTFKILDKTIEDLEIKGNIFSYVMLAMRNALDKNKKTDLAQLEWKADLMERLTLEGCSEKKKQIIWYFITHCISFKDQKNVENLKNKINKKPKSMTLTEIVTKITLENAREEGKEEGKEEGEAKGEAKTETKHILKCFSKGMKIHEIAELLDISIERVKEVVEKK